LIGMQERYEQPGEAVVQKAAGPSFKGHPQPRLLPLVEFDRPARSHRPEPFDDRFGSADVMEPLKQRFPLNPGELDEVLRYVNTHARKSARFHLRASL